MHHPKLLLNRIVIIQTLFVVIIGLIGFTLVNYTGSLSARWIVLISTIALHLFLLKHSIKYTGNIINPLFIFICVLLFVYFLKFILIEFIPDVNVRYITQQEYKSLFYISVLYISIGTIMYYIGYRLKFFDSLTFSLPRVQFSNFEKNVLKKIMFIFCGIGLLACMLAIEHKGGLSSALFNMAKFRAGSPYQTFSFFDELAYKASLLPLLSILFLLSYYWGNRKKLIFLFISLMIILILLFAATGSRSTSLSIFIGIFIISLMKTHSRSTYRILLYSSIFFIVLIIIIHMMGTYRGATLATSNNIYQMYQNRIEYQSQNPFLSLANIPNGPRGLLSALVLIPDVIEPSYGYTLIQAFFKPIPSSILPIFSVSSQTIGNLICSQFDPLRQGGYAISIYGLFYYNFLLPGIIILSLIMGILCRNSYQYLITLSNYESFNISVYAFLMSKFFIEFFRTGGLIKLSADFFFILFVYLTVIFICKIAKSISTVR